MSKVRIAIPIESAEHAEWAAKVKDLEETSPEGRTDEQWDELAKLYEQEPTFGEGTRAYYVPAFDEMPADKIRNLPKELFAKGDKDQGAAIDAMVALLSMYMPYKVAAGLSIGQMKSVEKLIQGDSAGES